MAPERTERPGEVVLASRSPRRRELLTRIIPEFRVFPVDVDESSVDEKDPARFAVKAAVLKAKAAAAAFPGAVVIGADTVVAVGNRMLGKPESRESAREMLETLSGRRHRVITGIALFRQDEARLLTGWELTWVTFRELTGAMIEEYLDRNDYLDKAGAYAVQDVGDAFVKRLKGDYDNVVGFPVRKVAAMLARFMRPPLDVVIEDVDFPGSRGVGHTDGRKIVVPGGVLGDALRVQVVREPGGTAEAEILRVLRPSPHRTEPGCPHFGVCGGCLFQDTSYDKQVELKGRYLERILGESGLPAGSGDRAEVREVVPSPQVYGYRNKMEFGFGGEDGRLVLGLRERSRAVRKSRSHTVALSVCPIFGPAVEGIFPDVLDFARANGLAAYDAWTGRGDLRHLVLRESKKTGELMVLVVTRAGLDVDFAPLAAALTAKLPGLRSFIHVATARTCDIVSFEEMRLVLGAPAIAERLAGLDFRIYPGTFFQTNTAAAEGLYGAIGELAGVTPESRVLGLYCGAGAIELSLAGRAAEVRGIDIEPENIRAAAENAAANGIANAAFIARTVEKALRTPPDPPPDILVLDPPRAGLSGKAAKEVVALRVPVVVYVSCSPAALVRDLSAFAAAGYRLRTIAPFDFFPHTPHLETLAILTRAGGDKKNGVGYTQYQFYHRMGPSPS